MRAPTRYRVCALLAGWCLLAAAACAAKRTPARALDDAPYDFAVHARVSAVRDWTDDTPIELQPSHYILEPGGALRAATGPGAQDRYPPFVTRLQPHEVERLWRLIRDSGLLEEDNPIRVSASEQFTIPGRTNAELVVTFQGERWRFRTTLESGTLESTAVRRIVNQLAAEAHVK